MVKNMNPIVVRGGSWIYGRVVARADYRFHDLPGYRFDGLGFRVVCGSPVKPKEKQSER